MPVVAMPSMKRSRAVVVGAREEALEGEEHHEDRRDDDGRAGEQQALVGGTATESV
jgi:hypothetical protein